MTPDGPTFDNDLYRAHTGALEGQLQDRVRAYFREQELAQWIGRSLRDAYASGLRDGYVQGRHDRHNEEAVA